MGNKIFKIDLNDSYHSDLRTPGYRIAMNKREIDTLLKERNLAGAIYAYPNGDWHLFLLTPGKVPENFLSTGTTHPFLRGQEHELVGRTEMIEITRLGEILTFDYLLTLRPYRMPPNVVLDIPLDYAKAWKQRHGIPGQMTITTWSAENYALLPLLSILTVSVLLLVLR